MFDLFRSQDKMKRIMLGAILGVVSLGMLLYLIPGQNVPTMGGEDQVVAEVAGQKITAREVYRRIQGTFRQAQLPPDVLEVYVPQLIQQMVNDRAVGYEAARLGFKISDAELAREIRAIPQFAAVPADQYQAMLEQMGYTVPEFESNFRTNALEVLLKNVAAASVIITPQEVEKAYREANEKIKIAYVVFPPDKFKGDVNPTPAELQAYYDQHKATYTTPESRNLQVILIDQDKVAATVQIPEAQLRAYYDSHKDDFRTPERVKVRHILLQTTGKSPDEVKKIKAKAEELLKQAKSGADFAELAKKNSQDPGSAVNGGDLGWVVRGQTVKNFENAAFSLKPGQISDLVTTEYGFHIIKVEDKEAAGLQPFDKVKDQISAELSKQQVNDKMQSLADQARAQLLKAPANGEQIANSLGLQFVRADNVLASGPIPGVGVNKDLSDAIASLAKGQVTQVIQVTPARLAVAAVTAINPPHLKPFSEVEAQVRSAVVDQKAAQLLQQKAKEAADAAIATGDLQGVAKKYGLEVKDSDLFTRNGSVGGNMGASFFSDLFNKPVGGVIGPINAAGQTVVAKLVDKTEPDMKDFAAQRDSIIQNLKQKKSQERDELFTDSIVEKLVKEGKIKYHKDVFNQILQHYRAS